MSKFHHLVVFSLDDQQYALLLPVVERVINAVAVTPLPEAPDIVLGVINIYGEIIPVMNIRKRFGLPEREIDIKDQLIISRSSCMSSKHSGHFQLKIKV